MTRAQKEALFQTWLAEHRGIILKVARSFTHSEDDLKDLVQEILVRIWTGLPTYRQESQPATWIYRVALNRALIWGEAEKKRRVRHTPWIEIADDRETDSLEYRERLDHLYREIRNLGEIDRSLILMHLDGVSYQDMARILGISESNVGARLTRSRKRLAENLKEV